MTSIRTAFVVFAAGLLGCPAARPKATSTETTSPTKSPTPITECRAIDDDPEWLAIRKHIGEPYPDMETFCDRRAMCCEIGARLETTPPGHGRVVQVRMDPKKEDGSCEPPPYRAITEYWWIDMDSEEHARDLRLLVVNHFAPYAPEFGSIDGTDTFLWNHEETCYGYGPNSDSGCEAGTVGSTKIALRPTPHLVDPSDSRVCPGTMPLLISADW
jgi:hypothetical protein